jgi:sialate O-acetylesterase
MTSRFCFAAAVCLQVLPTISSNGQASERIALDHAAVVVDAEQPSFVQYGIEELVSYLKESTGNKIPVVASPDSNQRVRIVVGPKCVQQLIPQDIPAEQFGDEGFLLRSATKGGIQYLIATGATPHGTKNAIGALMKTIKVESKSAFVPAELDRVHKPTIAKRGMHFNGWPFNAPYSFRNWREEDWKSYLDILAYQGVNLFYLWPFMEIMPVPLSAEDRAYLEECRRVVDYAQKKHGMEVWIMQCTNRVAKDDCGVKDPRVRPYWRPSQEDLNPGNPEHFKAIMASREALYKILNNVDGVCNIDSDPGEYPGSPLSDYIKVLNGCRDLLDRHNLHGKQTKLISWMWTGWGLSPKQMFDLNHQAQTLESLKAGLREPWGLVAPARFVSLCRKANILSKTVFLPYGAIEGEPAYPGTNVDISRMRGVFALANKNPELAGAMGNLQTPLLQFPHMFYYTTSMTDADYRQRTEREVLLDVSWFLYPAQKELIADCYAALKETNPGKIQSTADRLSRVLQENELGRPGLFGRKLFPDSKIVAQSLVLQLNATAARERLVQQITPSTSPADCEQLLLAYFDTYLAWDLAHGWHSLWGWKESPLGPAQLDKRFASVFKKLAHALGDRAAADACFARLTQSLTAKYDKEAVEVGCITPVKTPVLAALTASQDIKLNRLFSDNGILQRDTKVTLWGTTEGVEPVTVTFMNQSATAEPVENAWQVQLGPFAASHVGTDLVVAQGKQQLKRNNIVVGDIWLCSGQSNMEMAVRQCEGKSATIAAARNANLRLFTVPRKGSPNVRRELDRGDWQQASPANVASFSAVGYFFGHNLEATLKVPVGLINVNQGGTTAERWMARKAIDSNRTLRNMKMPQGKSDLYNSMIAPLAPLAIKGAIWYQGESNADRAYDYRHVLAALIQNWRQTFNNADLPFLIVELAPFKLPPDRSNHDWAMVRESQQWVAKNVPSTATVSIVDLGDESEHPPKKRQVGERLALAARKIAYREKINSDGPQFESFRVEGSRVVVHFKNATSGLVAKGGELAGFTLAGEDKKFHPAKATIDRESVVVTCDGVTSPKAVRLGWDNFPIVNLWNKNGLPAHPFRSDDWEAAAVTLDTNIYGKSERFELTHATIVADPDAASFVKYAVEELASYLSETSGVTVPITSASNGKAPCLIAVGPNDAEQLIGKPLATDGLGEEGYVLQSIVKEGKKILVAAGANPRGTKAAVGALMKLIEVTGKTPFVNAPLDVRSKPAFATRGMHFNGWPFGHPYTFRGWSETDWQRYLDVLAYQNINLIYVWPFMEIMPVPLSAEDRGV